MWNSWLVGLLALLTKVETLNVILTKEEFDKKVKQECGIDDGSKTSAQVKGKTISIGMAKNPSGKSITLDEFYQCKLKLENLHPEFKPVNISQLSISS